MDNQENQLVTLETPDRMESFTSFCASLGVASGGWSLAWLVAWVIGCLLASGICWLVGVLLGCLGGWLVGCLEP